MKNLAKIILGILVISSLTSCFFGGGHGGGRDRDHREYHEHHDRD